MEGLEVGAGKRIHDHMHIEEMKRMIEQTNDNGFVCSTHVAS